MLEMSSGIFLDYMNQSRWQNQFSAILTDLDVAVGRILMWQLAQQWLDTFLSVSSHNCYYSFINN